LTKSPTNIDKHVGSRLRMRRMLIGMSQEKLGDALGLTFQQVQKYEKGSNRIGASRLQHISEVLNVKPAFFFDEMPAAVSAGTTGGFAEDSSSFIADFLSSSEGLLLNKAFVRIKNPKLRRKIIDLITVLAESEDATDTATPDSDALPLQGE
jgi:transcriptional regulator with XRE-family HTH domain